MLLMLQLSTCWLLEKIIQVGWSGEVGESHFPPGEASKGSHPSSDLPGRLSPYCSHQQERADTG